MKGIILTGGKGTRLYPASKTINKGLLPVYDKPMIYYPLSTLMLSGIKDVLVIASERDIERFKELLGDGSQIGINISYEIEYEIKGIGQAFIMAEDFIGNDSVSLILGDNIFFGQGLSEMLIRSVKTVQSKNEAIIFGYGVKDPERYGVVTFNNKKKVINIEEKPNSPKSNYAVVGLYFYPNDVIDIAKSIEPSKRGELEITSVNQKFLEMGKLNLDLMGRGFAWLDTGTQEAMNNASNFIKTIEDRQGLKVGCIEEVAYRKNFINQEQLEKLSLKYSNDYGRYLKDLVS